MFTNLSKQSENEVFMTISDETVTLGVTSPESAQSNNGNYTGDFSVRSVSSDEGVDLSEVPVNNKSGAAPGSGKRVRSKTVTYEIEQRN
jgi:hypothetical protein